jgi:hypothetical protein
VAERLRVFFALWPPADAGSNGPNMPDLTMLINAKIRVFARSITVRLKCKKCFAPAVPVSTTVVTPERKE